MALAPRICGMLVTLVLAGSYSAQALGGDLSDLVHAPESTPRPVFLVHGWGPPALVGFQNYVRFLSDDGFPARRIHLLYYSFQRRMPLIKAQLISQIRAVMATYPAGTRFDIIGHSTGQFVGLYAAMEAGFGPQLHTLVGLSGIGHGWDCAACQLGMLGSGENTLAPANNDFINDFYQQYAAEIAKVTKCSLFSPEDGLIKPYDSGRFDDGINIEVPDMRHMDSVKKRENYEIMKDACYNGSMLP